MIQIEDKPFSSTNKIQTTQSHIVNNLAQPMRLQEYGVGIFSSVPTKSAWKKAIKKNRVKVNGQVAATATLIHGGENIELSLPEAVPRTKKLHLALELLYEDDYLALIHKPPGIAVSGNKLRTIANALDFNLTPSGQPDTIQPQPVHRLDYETSGILLVGKTGNAIRTLNKMFENNNIHKVYYAVTIGEMGEKGEINLALDGKVAKTSYELSESVSSKRFGKLNIVKLMPSTGRTHQLRKHLFHIGNPILGDKKYGLENLILKGKGLYLHAYSLNFMHPFTKEEVLVKDDLPAKFRSIFPRFQSSET